MTRLALAALALCAAGCAGTSTPVARPVDDQWPAYAGAAGARSSPLAEVSVANVGQLQVAWTYHTGELGRDARDGHKLTFEATPVHFDGRLYLATAYGRIVALDPATGEEIWHFDAGIDRTARYSEVTSRGVSAWRDSGAAPDAPCARRIFAGTIDARLLALDAATGNRCAAFGNGGAVALAPGAGTGGPPDYQVTSPPAIVGDLVITGSSIGDNWHADTGSGVVRAFDARTGAERWRWSPLAGQEGHTGAGNAWSVLNVDAARDLVFVPTGSPSPDFFGGLRPGANAHANSVVALRASTGALVWSFQTVHHDLWDYDLAAQPVLVDVPRDGRVVAAIAQPTKTGWLFVLDRETGAPLFDVEERPAPPSDVAGDAAWPTQPASPKLPLLMPQGPLTPDTAWGPTAADREECRGLVARLRSQGIFTPPSLQGTIIYPGNGSGTNWGSAAYASGEQLLVLNTSRLATLVQLLPRGAYDRERAGRRRRVGVRQPARDALRHAADGSDRDGPRDPLQSAAVGHARGREPGHRDPGLGGAARPPPRRPSADGARRPATDRHADQRRPDRHRGRAGLHRGDDGPAAPRLRADHRPRGVARRAALRRHRHADDLPGGRPPVRRDRRRGPRQGGAADRRRRRGVRPAAMTVWG